jgi:hypothetical protein
LDEDGSIQQYQSLIGSMQWWLNVTGHTDRCFFSDYSS